MKNQNAILTAYDGYLAIACNQTNSTPGAYIIIDLPCAGTYNYTIEAKQLNTTNNSISLSLFTTSGQKISDFSGRFIPSNEWDVYNGTFTTTANGQVRLCVFLFGNSDISSGVCIKNFSISYGSSIIDYAPFGHIGIISSTGSKVYFDLQGNELYGLDSIYCDILNIDANGHVIITKKVEKFGFDDIYNP